jgi:hypothetical protein
LTRKLLHGAIVLLLCGQCLYAALQVFVVLAPEGSAWGGPLGFQAREIPLDLLIRRRLYALEGWLAFSTLALYVALTSPLRRSDGPP